MFSKRASAFAFGNRDVRAPDDFSSSAIVRSDALNRYFKVSSDVSGLYQAEYEQAGEIRVLVLPVL
jgi:hypothetical protein